VCTEASHLDLLHQELHLSPYPAWRTLSDISGCSLRAQQEACHRLAAARLSTSRVNLKMRFTNVNQRTARCCTSSFPLQRHRCQVFNNVQLSAQPKQVCPHTWQTTIAHLL